MDSGKTITAKSLNTKTYREVLTLIEKGLYEEASQQLRNIRQIIEFPSTTDEQKRWQLLSVLLSSRIALKGGLFPDHIQHIQTNSVMDPFLRGELNFVKGLYHFNKGEMPEGTDCFAEAYQSFILCNKVDRYLIARYNYLIGRSHGKDTHPHWLFAEFRDLEGQAETAQNQKIVGLVLRQKSMLYKEQQRWTPAKMDGLKAVHWLEIYGAYSDYQMALLNMVDIYLALDEKKEAEELLERVIPPLDPRVIFPLSYFQHRLAGSPLALHSLSLSCPHFRERYEAWKAEQPPTSITAVSQPPQDQPVAAEGFNWNPLTGELLINNQCFRFRLNSMEKMLIDNVIRSPISKSFLSERLWPGYSEVHLLDNRLHRLVSRVNKKIGGFILYTNGQYSLNLETY